MSDDIYRTKILLLGQRRSGKTSIQQVLFNEGVPKQTFYLEPTTRILKHRYDTVIPLEIWDCPGNATTDSLGVPLSRFSLIIFVIDIQDSYPHPISRLLHFFTQAYQECPTTPLEVFVHKSEAIADEYKYESFRPLHDRILDSLEDALAESDPSNDAIDMIPINFHLTSIYDHSLHEAFSKVLGRIVDSLPWLEELLNSFCANSQASKAYIFDIKSGLRVAHDGSPPVGATHELCCDYIKTLNAFGPLYRSESDSPLRLCSVAPTPKTTSYTPSSQSPSPQTSTTHPQLPFYPSSSLSLSSQSNATQGTTITYHQLTPHLALLAVLPTSIWEGRRGLVEYNVVWMREGVREIWEEEWGARGVGSEA
ncbi:uncharacterized protein STEHIDRAFT_49232 [Stereum hirsutum FP-91666 SS1]|uniref:uncharacterized protein n=1 Tax=Stereum hirsutum (strain FP-91666) TaxID=721885 RepID=UPI0004409E33|nr:uncharacterized protein STEHIDRAFT_49232 [Stereum hirsutum FP-91666 SS1]EIM91514.1 hypothetical protein STEHIDRAFT_49232 [Stereum hirsutum FP-91666 SS1]